MTAINADSPDFIQKFEVLENLFMRYDLVYTDEMDHFEREDLGRQRQDLVKKMGWDKMAIEELRKVI